MRKKIDWKKYAVTFVLTCLIFGAVLYINDVLGQKRVQDVKSIQDQISLDLLSSETQFNLLTETPCKNVNESILSPELDSLSSKLSYMEANDSGAPNSELVYLKKYYSLLEIKDFLLVEQINEKCKGIGSNTSTATTPEAIASSTNPVPILYFYGNKSDCPNCDSTSDVLTYLRQQYPELRIYSFDSTLNLSAINSLKSVYNISADRLPAIVVNGDTYYGFKSIDEMKDIIPLLKKIDAVTNKAKTASTTSSSSSTTSAKASTTIGQ